MTGQKATCSVSAKKLSTFLFKTNRPIGVTGTNSSGIILLGPANRSQSSFHLLLRQSARRVPILDKNLAQLLHKDHDGGNLGLYLQVLSFIPYQRTQTLFWCPVKFHKM